MRPSGTPFTTDTSYLRRQLPSTTNTRIPSSSQSSPILHGLNQAQREAVTTPADVVQILAPPGSGKTRTLTSRVAYLLSEPHWMRPENVIVATFTVKAANEMKQRLSDLVGADVGRRLVLGTFHSIARRYLIKYGHLIGLRPGWGIADAADTKAICQRIIKRRKMGDSIDPRKLQSRISHFKARNLSPRANEQPVYTSTKPMPQGTAQKQNDIANEEFVEMYDDYHAMLEASNILDYDDLLLRCLEMIRQFPECVSNIEMVLIDEFQDTNVVQYELMKHLAWKNKRVTIVGDPDQSIYGFRAAEIGNLKRMRQLYPETLVVNLEENYRSSASILSAALEVIIQDKARPDKPLVATHAIGPSPVLRRVPTPASEATWIVGEIKRMQALTANMVKFSGIAILVRSSPLTRVIETALAREGVPYKMVGGTRFFDRAEIKVIIDYLRVLQNPANNDAVARVVNVPSRKVGETTVKALLEEAERRKKTLWELMCKGVRGDMPWGVKVSTQAEKGLGSFTAMMLGIVKKLDEVEAETTLADLLKTLLDKIGYEDHVQRVYPEDFDGRWANVEEVISQARETSVVVEDDFLPEIEGVEQHISLNTPRLALDNFLANVALVNERKAEELEDPCGEVTISTIHAAKGLEWPVVFIPALYEGSIPHSRAEDTDEERRLLYVAMTRAEALLYMSCPFRTPTGDKIKLSQFVDAPRVTRVLEKKAPEFTFSAVQIVAKILRQDCPTEQEIEACVERKNLMFRMDNQIPDKDPAEKEKNSEDADDNTELGASLDSRGRQINGGARNWTNMPVTTEDRLRYGKMTTADKIGFQSASSHLSALKKQGSVNCEAEKASREKRPSIEGITRQPSGVQKRVSPPAGVHHTSARKTAASTSLATEATSTTLNVTSVKSKAAAPTSRGVAKLAKLAKATANQGSITNFFTKKPQPKPARKPETATDVVKALNKTNMSLKEQMDSLPQPIIPKRAAGDFIMLSSSPQRPPKKSKVNPVSRTRMSHAANLRLPNKSVGLADDVTNLDENIPTSPPHNIPSSPVFRAFCEDLKEQELSTLAELENIAPPRHGISHRGEMITSEIDVEPEPELPSFNTSRNVYNPPVSYSAGTSKKPVKRTLGVRRTLNGWQDRKHR